MAGLFARPARFDEKREVASQNPWVGFAVEDAHGKGTDDLAKGFGVLLGQARHEFFGP